jgi:hypothetical protein
VDFGVQMVFVVDFGVQMVFVVDFGVQMVFVVDFHELPKVPFHVVIIC